jgi:hypothetical protein
VTNLTTKQFGDACEHRIISELLFAGIPTIKVPDGWRNYDLVSETPLGLSRISVKGLRYGNTQQAAYWLFRPDGFDWLAVLRISEVKGDIAAYLVPREKALAISSGPDGAGNYRLRCNHEDLQRYRENFRLKTEP